MEEKQKKKNLFFKIVEGLVVAGSVGTAIYGMYKYRKEHDAYIEAEARADELRKSHQYLLSKFEKRSSQQSYYTGKRSAKEN